MPGRSRREDWGGLWERPRVILSRLKHGSLGSWNHGRRRVSARMQQEDKKRKEKKCLETQDDWPLVILGLHLASQFSMAGREVGGGAPMSRLQRG